MAISKLILNGEVQMDVTSDTVTAGSMLSGTTATKNDGTKATGTIITKTSSDLTASGATVTAPAGYYANAASKAVATTTHPNPTVSFNSSTRVVTASHAQTAGYVTAGTTTSTITLSAGSAFPPAVTITKAPTFSINSATGVVTASYTGSSSITPTVNAGWVTAGTAGTISTTGTSTYQLTSKAAATIYPSTADQTISSYRWLTGAQTIKSVTTSNLTAENIAEGIVVKIGDADNASRIAQITGTHSGGGGGFTADQIAMKSISGSISGSATTIGSYAFYACGSLITASFSKATSIGTYAFYNCIRLTTASFPVVTTISSYAFYNCSSLTTTSFPMVTTISSYAFYNCIRLTTASFPSATIIGGSTFVNCSSLTTVSFPVATSIGMSAFVNCSRLTAANFPMVSIIGAYAFISCYSLSYASFPAATSIGMSAFSRCYNLLSLYLLGSSVVSLQNTAAFTSTPIAGYTTSTGGVYGSIFVPSSLYNSYITATNWTTYSARIVSV